jgi:pimeloyl-ACP methyl ester carboxylesterase
MKVLARIFRSLLVFLSIPWGVGSAQTDAMKLGPFERTRPRTLSVPMGEETFAEYDALNGSIGLAQQCSEITNSFWVEVEKRGECIRYYSGGWSEDNSTAIVYFPGDAILRNSKAVRFIGKSYLGKSPASITSDMYEWSEKASVPVVFLARPGLYGSSGDHNQRRHKREVDLMNGALDQLKQRYGIKRFILAGQSGGGHIVASLLTQRKDIKAVVISSGLLAVKRVTEIWDRRRSVPGPLLHDIDAFYDPVDEIQLISNTPAPIIWVLSDPEDLVIPFSTQLFYVRKLKAAGFNPYHIYVRAGDRQHHGLYKQAELTSALIAQGKTPRQIMAALQAMDLEQIE